MKYVSSILFIYYIKILNFFFCCILIDEFMLPLLNILPHTYRYLSAITKYIEMQYQVMDACPKDNIIYDKQHELGLCQISNLLCRYNFMPYIYWFGGWDKKLSCKQVRTLECVNPMCVKEIISS